MSGLREVSVLFLVCCQSWPAQKPEHGSRSVLDTASELRVTVRVYNSVNLSTGELNRAEGEAAKIFQFTGIHLTWTTGLLIAAVNDNTPSERWDPASLQLRIWTRAMAGKRLSSSETMGFCVSLKNGDAVVLADAVQKRAVFGTTDAADLIGLAMAHELGHLLLRSAAHSVTGIMRSRWTERALRADGQGYLRFTAGEAESMRNEVRRRMGEKS
jgi:hypothetical protein